MDYNQVIDSIIYSKGIVMLVGGIDTGKTTFCAQIANEAVKKGIKTAVVDGDIGQSEIGIPGVIGMSLLENPVELLSELKPKKQYFVGVTNPSAHILESAVGIKKMVEGALELGAELIIVDTTGFVEGPIARRLKTAKYELIRPNFVVGFQKHNEIERLLIPFTKMPHTKVYRLESSSEVQSKSPEYRAVRRRQKFSNAFNEAEGHIIHLDQVRFWNTEFCCGRPVKWQFIIPIEKYLKTKIYHAEESGDGLFIITDNLPFAIDAEELAHTFKLSKITIQPLEYFTNRLVGLLDENGNCIETGIIASIDFRQRLLFVLSPIRTISPAKIIKFGAIRVGRDGKELN